MRRVDDFLRFILLTDKQMNTEAKHNRHGGSNELVLEKLLEAVKLCTQTHYGSLRMSGGPYRRNNTWTDKENDQERHGWIMSKHGSV